MDIVLNRRGSVPLKDQLSAQIEMKILAGDLAPGQKLPSVRALARRLGVHANTVSAAYQDREAGGQIERRPGSGVYVRRTGPTRPGEVAGLDEKVRLALEEAAGAGFSGADLRDAVRRWLERATPRRVVVVDTERGTAELLVHEIRQVVDLPVSSCALSDLVGKPSLLAGAVGVTLPYHVDRVRKVVPDSPLQVITIEPSAQTRRAVLDLPPGAIVLIVSHAKAVLPFAAKLVTSLRGDEVLIEAHPLGSRKWRRLVSAADAVFVDALSRQPLLEAAARRVQEFRLVTPSAADRLLQALGVVLPSSPPPARASTRRVSPPRPRDR